MAKIKSYTNLEQSKKLANILPLESADMHSEAKDINGDMVFIVVSGLGDKTKSNYGSPVWSLAVLLSMLPPYLFEFERGIDLNIYPNLNGKGWHCSYMPNCIENMKKDKFRLIMSGDNLVDACVTMIKKLYELKML